MNNWEDFEKDLDIKYDVKVQIRNNTFGDWCFSIGDYYEGGFTSWYASKLGAIKYLEEQKGGV